jgi:hypothetical protein
MTPKKQVSPVIRISQGERDASARATHLEAATRKFLVTTNERKQMSTKTNFKRIALVAVAALGLGVLSSVPSQAQTSGLTLTVTDGTSSFTKSDSTTAATMNVTGLIEAADSVTITAVFKSKPSGGNSALWYMLLDSGTSTMTSARVIDTQVAAPASGAGTVAPAATRSNLAVQETTTIDSILRISANGSKNINETFAFQIDSNTARTAGTYTYTIQLKAYDKNSNKLAGNPDLVITKDINIVVAAASNLSTTPSAVTSFVDILSSAQAAGTADATDAVVAVEATAGTAAGYIFVGNRNAENGSSTAQDSITVTVTGAGQVCGTTGFANPTVGLCGQNIKVSAIGDYQFAVQGNGTAGVGTITVSSSVAGWSVTKSATFFSKSAKTITATIGHPLLKVGTNAGAVRANAVDANGVNWTGTAYIVASSAADALVAGSTTPVSCGTYSTTDGRFNCPVTALTTGTAKFKIIDASTVALATATSNEVTVTVTNTQPASVKLSFDKASYAPNERARIYVTPLDSAGKEIQSITSDLLFTGGISVNGAISFTGSTTTAESLTATSITTSPSTSSITGAKAGSMVYTVYMPSAGGTVTLSAVGGNGLPVAARVAVTASATVTDSGAAALAAVNALATTVASLRTLITTLTNLVLKIQKKVKA